MNFRSVSTGDLVRINDVGYTWPDDDGDANQVLQTDGSRQLRLGDCGNRTYRCLQEQLLCGLNLPGLFR